MHPGRILGIVMGLVILLSVFLLPMGEITWDYASYYLEGGSLTLYGIAEPTMTSVGTVHFLNTTYLAFAYLLIVSFILLIIAGVLGYFTLWTGGLGIVGMALITAGSYLTNVPVAWNVAFYVIWAASIVALGTFFWRRRSEKAKL